MLRRRGTTALGVLLALPLLLTACANDPSPGDSTDSPGSSKPSLSECLRGKGYDLPDTGSGGQTLDAPAGVDAEQWQQDLTACVGDGTSAGEADAAPATRLSPAQMQQLATCIREHGFEDFPDDPTAGYTPDDPEAYRQVSEQCTATLDGDEG